MKKINKYKMGKVIWRTAVASLLMAVAACSECGGKRSGAQDTRTPNDISVDTALQSRLRDFADRPRPEGKFAFHVYDITAGKPVYGHNDTLALPSASCMKLLSGIAGLRILGTDYHYWTAVFSRGKVGNDGTLDGDIAFRAGLDPQLMAPDLNDFARAVRRKGVTRIGGRLIVDLTLTKPVTSEEHWYPWDLTFYKYGLLYKGQERVVKALKASLRGTGVTVADSQIVMSRIPKGFACMHVSHRSINDVMRRMWKNSSNTQATAMLYTIGKRVCPKGDPVMAGVDYLRHFMADTLGLNHPSLCVHDGCGLCVHNALSPLALTTILRYGHQDKGIRASLERNLSVSGLDGTLAREMCGPKLRGKIRAKTGTLSNPYGISSLAGFCEGGNGHTLAFAIMNSEMSVLDARVLQNRLCEALVKADDGRKGASAGGKILNVLE